MKKILLTLLLTIIPQVSATTSTTTDLNSVYATKVQEQVISSTTPITTLISHYSEFYGVSSSTVSSVIKCESGFKQNAIGDNGNSFGLVQIHLPSNPTITREQALDPDFAVSFLAKQLASKKGKLWTCYRLLNLKT
jgi:hypothetical protein